MVYLVEVQSLSHVWLFVTPWNRAHHASLSFNIFQSLFKLMSIELWCYLTISPSAAFFSFCLQSFPVSESFSNESALRIMWTEYWSFSFSNRLSNDYSGLISFRIDWFDLHTVQGILKSLLEHHNLKAWILQCSDYFYSTNLLKNMLIRK